MKRSEASDLLTRCSGFDNRQPSAAAAIAWASALRDVPLDADTYAAVDRFYGTPPKDPNQRLWIQPHDVRRIRRTIRSERLQNFQYEPVGDETPGEYLARLRGQQDALASGGTAAPSNALALTGGPHRAVADALEGIGRTVPDTDDEALADTVRRAGPLGVRCPACGAALGRPCKTPGGSNKQPIGKPRRRPHSARIAAASGRPAPDPSVRAAEAERQAAIAQDRLTRLTPAERADLERFQRQLLADGAMASDAS